MCRKVNLGNMNSSHHFSSMKIVFRDVFITDVYTMIHGRCGWEDVAMKVMGDDMCPGNPRVPWVYPRP